tara:strand:+ start:1448 stop:4084 length:2637 start_codon:yes stop_codon:yes gene_type:complete
LKKCNLKFFSQVIFTLFLSACGGGGSTPTDTTPNKSPIVNAGGDLTKDENTNVTLAGTAIDTDGSIATYSWIQTSGTEVSLTSADTALTSFIAPDINESETLTFTFTAIDNDGASSSDTISVSVININKAPIVNAGEDVNVAENTSVTLAGTATDTDGSIATYTWIQASGTEVSLTTKNKASTSFIAPDINENETLTFMLTATDNGGASSSDVISVIVTKVNNPPIVNAGEDLTVDESTSVTLAGTATDTDGTIIKYSWAQTSGSEVSLTSTDKVLSSFIAPENNETEVLTFSLTVTDSDGDTASDSISIKVLNIAPGVSGQITFERIKYWERKESETSTLFGLDPDNSENHPARAIVVNLKDFENNTLSTTITDDSGNYLFSLLESDKDKWYSIEVVSQLEPDGKFNNGFSISVKDPSTDVNIENQTSYIYATEQFQYVDKRHYQDVLLSGGWNGVDKKFEVGKVDAQPFAILDSVFKGLRYLESFGVEFNEPLSPLNITWTMDDWDDLVLENFFNAVDEGYLSISAPYSEQVIIHLFTHFFEIKVLDRGDTRGGGYSVGHIVNFSTAFSEGFAAVAIPAAVLDDWNLKVANNKAYDSNLEIEPIYEIAKETYQFDSVSSSTDLNGREYNYQRYKVISPYEHSSVALYMLSFLSDRPSTERTINLYKEIGPQGLLHALNNISTQPALLSLYSLSTELKVLYPDFNAEISNLEEKLAFSATDMWGTNRTDVDEQFKMYAYNNDLLPSETYLPIYQSMALNDISTLCFNGGFAPNNQYRPGTIRHAKFTALNDVTYVINIDKAVDIKGDFHFYSIVIKENGNDIPGIVILYSNSGSRIEFAATAGQTYVIQVYGNNYSQKVFNINETICTDIKIATSIN